MLRLSLLFVLIIASACSLFEARTTETDTFSQAMIDRVAQRAAEQYQLRRLQAEAPSNSQASEATIRINFIAPQRLEFHDARLFFIQIIDSVVSGMNEELEATGSDLRVTSSDLDISVAFKDNERRYVEKPYIAFVYLYEDNAYYSVYDFSKAKLQRVDRVFIPRRP